MNYSFIPIGDVDMPDSPESLENRIADFGWVLHIQGDDGVGAYVTDKRGSMIWWPASSFGSVDADLAEATEWVTELELQA